MFEEANPQMAENDLHGLDIALKSIKERITNQSTASICQDECLQTVRDVILQLIMLKWGYYGPAETTAGNYLAYHRSELGHYYINSIKNQWPYYPLHEEPNELEVQLNDILISLTEKMSHEKIKGVSILDWPAFGAKKSYFDDLKTNDANWPNELNFHYRNSGLGNMSKEFKELKETMDEWKSYMYKINENGSNSALTFPQNKMSNPFDYSKVILQDFLSFLQISSESHITVQKDKNPIWRRTARSVFKHTIDDDIVLTKGLYDKAIIQCSFRKRLEKITQQKSVLSSGCELFEQSLTSNGLCYTFNALRPSDIWQPSKAINAFQRSFKGKYHQSLQNYAGAGISEGNQFCNKN